MVGQNGYGASPGTLSHLLSTLRAAKPLLLLQRAIADRPHTFMQDVRQGDVRRRMAGAFRRGNLLLSRMPLRGRPVGLRQRDEVRPVRRLCGDQDRSAIVEARTSLRGRAEDRTPAALERARPSQERGQDRQPSAESRGALQHRAPEAARLANVPVAAGEAHLRSVRSEVRSEDQSRRGQPVLLESLSHRSDARRSTHPSRTSPRGKNEALADLRSLRSAAA